MRKHNFNHTLKCLMIVGVFTLGIGLVIASGGSDIPYIAPADVPSAPPAPTPWKFGVMADTQWTPYAFVGGALIWGYDPEGTNPNSVAGSIITQLNQEFINHGVKFVVAVGDITDTGADAGIASRAALAQDLFDAGIGFFTFRGNHETYYTWYYPSEENNSYGVTAMKANFPQHRGTGPNLFGATNFSSPSSTAEGMENMATDLNGMSYAFDYGDEEGNDATFVMIDPWATDNVATWVDALFVTYGYPLGDQVEWATGRLDLATRGTEHAFVFSHQLLMAGNHSDSPFGLLYENTEAQNTFYASMVNNDVAFYIGGHDHMHHRSTIKSPDGLSTVEQVISQADCPKFYHPNYTSASWTDPLDPEAVSEKTRQTVISTEFNNVGYYIYTIEGPIVTVDYYSDATGGFTDGNKWPDGTGSLITPTFTFEKKETFRFSLNGEAFMVAQGGDYSVVTDTYDGTTMSLMGTNASISVEDSSAGADATAAANPLTKRITTAWKDKPNGLISSVLMLDGMNELGVERTEPYVLSMTAPGIGPTARLMAQTKTGEWVNAAALTAGEPGSTSGPASTAHSVGTYGMDSAANTVWAVLDYDGTFGIKIN
jgi:hypothetical protein